MVHNIGLGCRIPQLARYDGDSTTESTGVPTLIIESDRRGQGTGSG